MKICIVVDGYNAGKQFAGAIRRRGFYPVHIQSTPKAFSALSKFEERDYEVSLVYQNDLDILIEEIHEIPKVSEIVCVIAGSEPGVILADVLSEKLGLATTNGTLLSNARRNKFEMLEAVSRAGLAVPAYTQLSDLQKILIWITEHTDYPVVLKPVDSAGTDGVSICHNELDVTAAFNEIIETKNVFETENTVVLVESFLEGDEYVVNSVSCNGKHKVSDIWVYRKNEVDGKKIYDREELLDFEGALQSALVAYAHKVIDAVGIKFGPSHAEIIMTGEGPVLVEIAARISGATNMASSQECVGHDVVNLTIDSYTNFDYFMAAYHKPSKIIKYGMVVDFATKQEGIIIGERFTEKLSSMPSLKSMLVKKSSGDFLCKTKDLMSSPAKFHLVHESHEQIVMDYQLIQAVGANGFIVRPPENEFNKKTRSNLSIGHGIFSKEDVNAGAGLANNFDNSARK